MFILNFTYPQHTQGFINNSLTIVRLSSENTGLRTILSDNSQRILEGVSHCPLKFMPKNRENNTLLYHFKLLISNFSYIQDKLVYRIFKSIKTV